MAYNTAYEPSSDFIMDGILAWTQTYLAGGSAFSTTTQPTLTQVEQMIDMRTEEVAAKLVQWGYAAAQAVADVGSDVTGLLSRAIIMGVMVDIEMTKANRTQGREESARWQLFERRYNDVLKIIEGPQLEHMGATRTRDLSAGLVATGASWDEQTAVTDDEDRKGALFPRGYLDPLGRKAPEEATDPANG